MLLYRYYFINIFHPLPGLFRGSAIFAPAADLDRSAPKSSRDISTEDVETAARARAVFVDIIIYYSNKQPNTRNNQRKRTPAGVLFKSVSLPQKGKDRLLIPAHSHSKKDGKTARQSIERGDMIWYNRVAEGAMLLPFWSTASSERNKPRKRNRHGLPVRRRGLGVGSTRERGVEQ